MSTPLRCKNCGKKLGGLNLELCHVCREVQAQATARRENKAADKKVEQATRTVEQAAEVSARKMRFLTELLLNGGHVERACKAAGVSRVMMGRYRDEDPEFAGAWETVQEVNVENLESEADRRALGYQKELTFQGKRTGDSITEYSDNLLMFRLKALRPEKYRDGPGANRHAPLSDEELDEALQKMMRRRTARQTAVEPLATEAVN